jgi:integrase/recombinase XerD
MKMSAALTAYFYAKDLTPKSRVWYEQKIGGFLSWCESHSCATHQPVRDVEEIDKHHINEYLAHLRITPSRATGRLISGQTCHGYARAIKAFCNWCIKDELLPERVTRKLDMPKREQKVIPIFTRQQISQLFSACERPGDKQYPWLAERDKAILAVLLDTGIRASELCSLTCDRVILDQHDPYIRIMGKGRKEREIGLGVASRQQLLRYMHRFRPHTSDPHVFLRRDRRALDTHGLAALLYRLKQLAGVTGVRCSPHDFRHTFSFNFLANGGDVMKLSRLLGHTSLAVTEGYLRAFTARDARNGSISVLDKMRERQ